MGPAGTVHQTGRPLGLEPDHPPVRALPADTELLRHMRHRSPVDQDSFNQQGATVNHSISPSNTMNWTVVTAGTASTGKV